MLEIEHIMKWSRKQHYPFEIDPTREETTYYIPTVRKSAIQLTRSGRSLRQWQCLQKRGTCARDVPYRAGGAGSPPGTAGGLRGGGPQ